MAGVSLIAACTNERISRCHWTARRPRLLPCAHGADACRDVLAPDSPPGFPDDQGFCWLVTDSDVRVMDVRLSKVIRFGEGRKIDLLAQAFNVLNTKNLQAQFGAGRV